MANTWQHGHLRDDAGALVLAAAATRIGGGFALGAADETAAAAGAGEYQSGHLRAPGFGPLCTAAAGSEWRAGFLVDAAGQLVTGSTPPLRWQAGYLRDANGALVTV